jgi:hypothetical protein
MQNQPATERHYVQLFGGYLRPDGKDGRDLQTVDADG